MKTAAFLPAAFFLLVGCATSQPPLSENTVAYCMVNPTDAMCPGVMRRAGEENVTASKDALSVAIKTKEHNAAKKKPWYGRIIDVQVVSTSSPGTAGSGAALGSLAGQALYVDNTGWSNYSAMKQLGAGVVGAMIGSTTDQPPTSSIAIHYWVDRGGTPVDVVEFSSNGAHFPKGSCVEISNNTVTLVDTNKCKP